LYFQIATKIRLELHYAGRLYVLRTYCTACEYTLRAARQSAFRKWAELEILESH
jgi:hypothetical protein